MERKLLKRIWGKYPSLDRISTRLLRRGIWGRKFLGGKGKRLREGRKADSTGVSKKGFKLQKIAKWVLQKYSPPGIDSRHRGGVLATW